MGLELVELVMDTEREFGIEISYIQAAEIESVGDLYGFVLDKLEVSRRSRCPTQLAFYQVRAALLRVCRVNRSRLSPSLPTSSVIEDDTLKCWDTFEGSLGLRLPDTAAPLFGGQRVIPRGCETVGLLSRAVASLNLSQLVGDGDRRVEIWSRLRAVIKSGLPLNDQDLLWQHHFVHDLGFG